MSYVYKITNKEKKKSYIGQTNFSIQKRFQEHIYASQTKHRTFQNMPLYRAFRKYGIDNFSIEKIEECSAEIINEREIFWIEYYDSFNNGYNATKGGGGRLSYDRKLVCDTYLKTKSIKKTSEIVGCSQPTVSFIIHQNIPFSIIKQNYSLNKKEVIYHSKKVAMIDKNTKEILKVFPNMAEAGRYIGHNRSHIQNVCCGRRKTAYGYIWKYL